jgi:cyclohexyl-isocyanide hydratase
VIRRIAFLAFPRLTLLDLIGPYDALRRVRTMGVDPSVEHRVVAIGDAPDGHVADDSGLRFAVDDVYAPLDAFDLLVVPGGHGTRELEHDPRCLAYLRSWGTTRPIASVCTGALLLGAAGHLAGLRATTHFSAYDQLAPYCREVVRDVRLVDEGRVVTAGGVTSGIDLGLHLVGTHFGAEARQTIARQMVVPTS